MHPPETSLIPATVALARFVEGNGFASMFGWYPHWYLGAPYQYLTGPIIPLLQVLLHKVLPGFSLFDVTYLLLALSFLASILGWGILVKKISGKRFIGIVVGILLVILPWRYLSALALSEASGVIAKNLLPFVLISFWNYYQAKDRKSVVITVFSTSVLLLINTSIFSILIVGLASLVLAATFRKGKYKGLTKKIKSTIILVLISLVLVTLWYTPGYWWTVITNPSIGGASGIKVFLRIFDLLKASIPLVLAVVTVYFSGRIRSRLSVFSLIWVFTFLFLTIFRFIGDPDFWQDWTSWFSEIEIGVALLSAKLIVDIMKTKNFQFSIFNFQKYKRQTLFILVLLIILFVVTNYVYGLLNKPRLISSSIPKGVQSLEKLSELTAGGSTELTTPRVFLSGSTVFWANALYDLNQVRGGVDKAATHPFWDHAAFQLREGEDSELARAWLNALGVSYVLVHGPASTEVYHDFRYIDKWQEVGEVVWRGNGDAIIENPSSTAWVVDLESLKKVKPPQGGDDLVALNKYLSAKKRDALAQVSDNNSVLIETDKLSEGEGIVVAISKNSKWKSEDGKLSKDPLGNILLTPNNYNLTSFSLRYR